MQLLCKELPSDSRLCCVCVDFSFAGIETDIERTSVEDFPPPCRIRTIKEYMMARSCSINYPLSEAWMAGVPVVRLSVGFKTSISV